MSDEAGRVDYPAGVVSPSGCHYFDTDQPGVGHCYWCADGGICPHQGVNVPDDAPEDQEQRDEVDPEQNWAVLTGLLLGNGFCPLCGHQSEAHEGEDCVRSTLYSPPSCTTCRALMVQQFSLIVAPTVCTCMTGSTGQRIPGSNVWCPVHNGERLGA